MYKCFVSACLSILTFYDELPGNKEFWSIIFSFSCRRHKEKKDDGTEPEADPERDQRTVFAYQVKDILHAYKFC